MKFESPVFHSFKIYKYWYCTIFRYTVYLFLYVISIKSFNSDEERILSLFFKLFYNFTADANSIGHCAVCFILQRAYCTGSGGVLRFIKSSTSGCKRPLNTLKRFSKCYGPYSANRTVHAHSCFLHANLCVPVVTKNERTMDPKLLNSTRQFGYKDMKIILESLLKYRTNVKLTEKRAPQTETVTVLRKVS